MLIILYKCKLINEWYIPLFSHFSHRKKRERKKADGKRKRAEKESKKRKGEEGKEKNAKEKKTAYQISLYEWERM